MSNKRDDRPLAAIGIRISDLGKRRGDNGANNYSEPDQIKKGHEQCDQLGLRAAFVFKELDTSGTLPLDRRPKLLDAVERVERREIHAIVFPYRDRSDRSVKTKDQYVDRVEAAGGQVWAAGSLVSNRTADAWARSTLESVMNEMPARYAKEKVREAHLRAIAAGIPVYSAVPGYRKGKGGKFVVDTKLKAVAVEAFAMRDRRASINEIRRYLADHGVKRSYSGVEGMLRSKTYLGLVVHGDLAYRGKGVAADDQTVEPVPAHPAIVDRDVWQRVQDMRSSRGRPAKSDRLLARQGVLHCGTCGARMTATTNRGFAFYRCQHNASPDCPARATVSAERVEELVVEALRARRAVMRVEGVASADLGEQLHQAARDAQADLEAAVEAFAGLDGLDASKRRIAQLTQRWEEAKREADQHDRSDGAAMALRRMDDWDELTLEGRREVVRLVIARVTVDSVNGKVPGSSRLWDRRRVHVKFAGQG